MVTNEIFDGEEVQKAFDPFLKVTDVATWALDDDCLSVHNHRGHEILQLLNGKIGYLASWERSLGLFTKCIRRGLLWNRQIPCLVLSIRKIQLSSLIATIFGRHYFNFIQIYNQ